ncbi:MAG: M20/M25/M40 family metallo-hydrolase [Deltaproteobacteria bacterium]|nr:M20/M25/M40 family metallo-hydrolase [Deltaproteobacteria bacterium]
MAEPSPADLLKALVPFSNATRQEVQRFIAEGVAPLLAKEGFDELRLDRLGSLIGLRRAEGASGPPLILLAYGMDFPAEEMDEPYTPKVVDGTPYGQEGACIWGRGNSEHRGALASALHAMNRLARGQGARRRDLIFIVSVSGEDGHHEVARHLFEVEGVPLGPAVVVRNTKNQVCLGNKGSLGIAVTVRGASGHSSDPKLGRNAIEGAVHLLQGLKAYAEAYPRQDPEMGGVAMVPITIESWPKANAIPHTCRLHIIRRLIPGEEPQRAFRELEQALAVPGFDTEFTLRAFQYPMKVSRDGPLVQAALRAVAGVRGRAETCYMTQALDAGYFGSRGIEAISLGPGDIRLAHTLTDMVAVKELDEAAEIYYRLLVDLVGG